ncbi:MAG: hypothetical protein WAK13_10955, partial [Terriglobales bacterium]
FQFSIFERHNPTGALVLSLDHFRVPAEPSHVTAITRHRDRPGRVLGAYNSPHTDRNDLYQLNCNTIHD